MHACVYLCYIIPSAILAPLGSSLIAETNIVIFTKVPSVINDIAFEGQFDFPWCFESITISVKKGENNANTRIDTGAVVVSAILEEVILVPNEF
jgi:hypothetical protein